MHHHKHHRLRRHNHRRMHHHKHHRLRRHDHHRTHRHDHRLRQLQLP